MISRNGSDINLSDIVLNLGAVLLAAASAGFATFVVLSGPHPIVPITADGETFQIATQTGQGLADPIITGSIEQAPDGGNAKLNVTRDISATSNPINYKIRSIEKGTATIDFFDETFVYTMKVRVGDHVNGIGLVKSFEQKNGNWYVRSGVN